MRSVVVVFPASMCAMIPMLRVLARRAAVVLTLLLQRSLDGRVLRPATSDRVVLRKPGRGSTSQAPNLRGLPRVHWHDRQQFARGRYSAPVLFVVNCASVSKFLRNATFFC